MVASGLPTRNGRNHVVQVADLALDLLTRVETFEVPHGLVDRLQLRIGMNSGKNIISL